MTDVLWAGLGGLFAIIGMAAGAAVAERRNSPRWFGLGVGFTVVLCVLAVGALAGWHGLAT